MRRLDAGSPEPLGLTLVRGGANVAVFSAHAQAIEVCLFGATGEAEIERLRLPERTGDVFHGFIAGIAAGDRYGLRAHGPYDPSAGHRFNAAKLLVDPYARVLDRPFALDPAMFGEAPDGATRDDTDSGHVVPKGVATPLPRPAVVKRPHVPWSETIVYELHVRGFTKAHPDVPEAIRGTCAGLAHPAALEHLVRLGVTTVELMPIASTIDERHLARLHLSNYWGYNPAALFVPDARLAPGGLDELRACVAALHAAGIEVVLDIVLNHTGEGDEHGPTVSLRGLDNVTYYRTLAGDAARYADEAGCGNTLALDRPPVLRLALDALRHYAGIAGVDGFRFDLATTLGRRGDGFDAAAPFFQAVAQDPLLRSLKLIAEPWDVGPDGYRVGEFPASWGEWNDRYRDTVRRFWRGGAGCLGGLATRLAGSSDLFASRRRPPSRSINFVAAHDGFTLADLVSHETKHNDANGEGNRDGSDTNLSWNHGTEGPTADPAIGAARARDVRGLLATLLVSRGTPMLAMGDELGRTQRGNNNAYSQDNALTWIDWTATDRSLADLVATLIALRRGHRALRLDRWLTGEPVDASGIPDVAWRHPDGRAMAERDWSDRDAHALVTVFCAPATDAAEVNRVAIAFNAGHEAITVCWPAPRDGFAWRRRIDTSVPAPETAASPAAMAAAVDVVAPRAVVVIVEERTPVRRSRRSGIEPAALAQLAAAAGIATDWWDVAGRRHEVGPDNQRALLAAMGLAAASTDDARDRLNELAAADVRRPLPHALVARVGHAVSVPIVGERATRGARIALRLRQEDGNEATLTVRLAALPERRVTAPDGRIVAQRQLALPPLPAGYHTLEVGDGAAAACRIVVAPERCFLPADVRAGARHFGIAAHLYALRRHGDQGIGDLTTLGDLCDATAHAGGATVGINPLHALFAEDRERASPYYPSDRRFLDPIYIDLDHLPDLAASSEARAFLDANASAIAALSAATTVDYGAVWRLKRTVLDMCFSAFLRRASDDPLAVEFERFVRTGGDPLARFATFEAIAAAHPRVPWSRWPSTLRQPDSRAVADFARHHVRALRFALYLQWQAERQLANAARRAHTSGLAIGLYRDLAVGVAPDGAEVWTDPAAFARGVSIGAPPDPFSAAGQVWDLAPPIPHRLTAAGYAGFRDLLAANMRHAGALRIDHVMGLARLFWVPAGATAADGAYVSYPLDDLVAVLALESDRARCLVIGEDLGTVPEGLRERLGAADVLSYRVVWFEREGIRFIDSARYPQRAATCVSTHDLPTIAGWWSGSDIDEKQALGLLDASTADRERTDRRVDKSALVEALAARDATLAPIDPPTPHDAAITAAIHRFACATPSALVLIQADDLARETAALNLPNTDHTRPNWRRKIGIDTATLLGTPATAETLRDCAAARRTGSTSVPRALPADRA